MSEPKEMTGLIPRVSEKEERIGDKFYEKDYKGTSSLLYIFNSTTN
jgi:hypothetical protein